MSTIADKIKSLGLVKADLKDALLEKGQNPGNALSTYPDLIRNIETGTGGGEDTFSDPNLKWYINFGFKKNRFKSLGTDYFDFGGKLSDLFNVEFKDKTANDLSFYPGVQVNGKIFTKNSDYERYWGTLGDDSIIDVKLYYPKSPTSITNDMFNSAHLEYLYFSEDCKIHYIWIGAFYNCMSSDYKKSIGIKYNDGHIEYTLPDSLYGVETGSFYKCSFDTIKIGDPRFNYKDNPVIKPFEKTNIETLDFRPMSLINRNSTIDARLFFKYMFSEDSQIKNIYLSEKNINSLGEGYDTILCKNVENIITPFSTPFDSLSGFWGANKTTTRTIWCPPGSLDAYTAKFGSSWIIKETNSDGEITTN